MEHMVSAVSTLLFLIKRKISLVCFDQTTVEQFVKGDGNFFAVWDTVRYAHFKATKRLTLEDA